MSALSTLRDASGAVVLSAVLALAVNTVRKDGIPLVATEPYGIFVPCPEPGGEVFPLQPTDVRWDDARELLIDARPPERYRGWHAAGSVNVPFDFLEPVPDETIAALVATRSRRVVVYGDGLSPDTGEELARELSGRGMRNVHFVPGGVLVLQEIGSR